MRHHIKVLLFLMAFPIGLMGFIHFVFAALSFSLFNDNETDIFLLAALPELFSAFLLALTLRNIDNSRIGLRDTLLFATLTWVIMGSLGSLPIILTTHVSFTDGVFESISALTTTGATILSGLDGMPKTFLLYRQFLQWLGGLGVVIFVVAILPMLNVGGMKLLKAETPGPMKDDKLSPRAAQSAHYLWLVYLLLTLTCVWGYVLTGMSLYDAIAHSLSTVSTGGFSTYDASMGHFRNPAIFWVADIFMVLGAISFALHFRVARARSLALYKQDEEARAFIGFIVLFSVLITLLLAGTNVFSGLLESTHYAVFMLISFITSTGYGAGDYTHWPLAVLMLLIVAAYIGGCSGSTAGGNKVIRSVLAMKVFRREVHQQIYPDGVFIVKYQGKSIDTDVIHATLAFLSLSVLVTVLMTLVLMETGLDAWSAFTAVAACLNVLGPAFGELGAGFQAVSDSGTWVLSFCMILGRLEYFTVLALFHPGFWRN